MPGLAPAYNDRNINPSTRMDHNLYAFSIIRDRAPVTWPNSARVALAVVINVDFGDLIPEGGSAAAIPLREWSHRDYGARVGIFRLMQILDDLDIKATVPINDAVLKRSPAVVSQALDRGWELAGHGAKANMAISSAMSEEAEWAYITSSYAAIKRETGVAPRGWLGPAMTESSRTPFMLAKAGFDYTLDWGNDDQPYDFLAPEGKLTALPYSPDTSDAVYIGAANHTAWEFEDQLKDHFDTIYAEGASTGMTMTLGLQAHVSGQPFRSKYIRSFLEYTRTKADVWYATGSEVVDAYRAENH
ncbi:MAG: polysaccharide deacetylase family protein [bacterium]